VGPSSSAVARMIVPGAVADQEWGLRGFAITPRLGDHRAFSVGDGPEAWASRRLRGAWGLSYLNMAPGSHAGEPAGDSAQLAGYCSSGALRQAMTELQVTRPTGWTRLGVCPPLVRRPGVCYGRRLGNVSRKIRATSKPVCPEIVSLNADSYPHCRQTTFWIIAYWRHPSAGRR